MKRTPLDSAVAHLAAIVVIAAAHGCSGGVTVLDAPDAAAQDAATPDAAARDGGGAISWCGAPDDLPCCQGSPAVPPADLSIIPFIPPVFEPVQAADEATRAFIEMGGVDVPAVWRGVVESGDVERPSRVTLEVPSLGMLVFDFARAVADFPVLSIGAALIVSVARTESPYPPAVWDTRTVRLSRSDGSLLAAAGTGCDIGVGGVDPLPALFAPFVGALGVPFCREPAPVPSGGSWCYVGRTNVALALAGVATPIAPGDTARVSVGGASYDFTNYRFAFQDSGGPHVGGTCLPGIQPLCAFSAYAAELPMVTPAGTCAAPCAAPTTEIPWSYGLGTGLPGAYVAAGAGAVTATLARSASGALVLPFAFTTSRSPFLCFCARGVLTIAGVAPVTVSLGGLYHDSADQPVWMLVPLDETLAELDLDGRAFSLEITLQVFEDYASTTLTGVIDDPRR